MMVAGGPAVPRPPWADAAGGAALLALALFAVWAARDLPFGTVARPGAGFFPLGLGTILGGLGCVIFGRGIRVALASPAGRLWPDADARRRVLLMAGALFGYVLIVDLAGHVVATFLLCLVMLRAVAAFGWMLSLVYSLAVAELSWLLFARLLRVNLPAGLLF